MNRNKVLLLVLSAASFYLTACSGAPKQNGCPGGNCGGNGSVSMTLVADTLPANPSILSLQVTITSITFTPASGTATTVNLNPALTVDLMRLQTDTIFLGTFANIPAAQYSSATLTFTGNANITFLNDTNATLAGCPVNAVCPISVAASSNPVATISFTVSQNAVTGIGIDLNLANAVSISGANLAVNFANNNVLGAFTLPRVGSNLAAGQLDLIEDFTGVVSVGSNNVTVTSPTRGTLTATSSSSSFFDVSPSGTICPTPSTVSCVVNGQIASVDAFLNSDGTLSLKEYEPLVATQQDLVEGTVISVASLTQFAMVVTDKSQAATNSLVAGLNAGDLLTVNISNTPPSTVKPFFVDTKGLAVPAASSGLFQGQTDTTAIHRGQTVSVHVTSFTAASGTTIALVIADTATLRWSRFVAAATGATSNTQINVNTLPSYFGFTAASVFPVQVFSGTLGADGVTNLDGITTAASVTTAQPVGLRVLFLDNPGNTAQFPFMAAKIRQH